MKEKLTYDKALKYAVRVVFSLPSKSLHSS